MNLCGERNVSSLQKIFCLKYYGRGKKKKLAIVRFSGDTFRKNKKKLIAKNNTE